MFVTYHLVFGEEERRDIFARLNPGETWDGTDVEAMAIAQADELPLAFVLTTSVDTHTSKVAGSFFPSDGENDSMGLHLLDYLGWEIREAGKGFMLFDPISAVLPLARGLRHIGLNPSQALLVKLDDRALLDILAASA